MKRLSMLAVGTLLMVGPLMGAASLAGAAKSLAPVVKAVTPDHGSVNGGTLVSITGKNVITATAVDFGTTPATNLTFKSNNTIVATSPSGTGTVVVTVTTPQGTSSSSPSTSDEFSYVSTPAIQSLSPRVGGVTGGNRVTIIGSDFTGVTSVNFGSIAATSFVVDSSQTITAVSPASPGNATGAVAVTLSGSGGSSPQDPADLYTYALRVPVVKSVALDSGSSAGGQSVVITGSGFTKATAVDFGTNAAEAYTVTNSKTIDATTPAGTGTVEVTVTTSKGTSSAAGNEPGDEFTYTG